MSEKAKWGHIVRITYYYIEAMTEKPVIMWRNLDKNIICPSINIYKTSINIETYDCSQSERIGGRKWKHPIWCFNIIYLCSCEHGFRFRRSRMEMELLFLCILPKRDDVHCCSLFFNFVRVCACVLLLKLSADTYVLHYKRTNEKATYI